MNDGLTTADTNPYQSPLTVEQPASPRVYPSAAKAFLAGAWQGAKFGGKWMSLILGILTLVVCVAFCVGIIYRFYRQGYDVQALLQGLKIAGLCVFTTAYVTAITAIVSAIMMGIGEVATYCRAKKRPDSTTAS
jgi:hypothetical protein